jgi:hypothetical protein
MQNKSFRVEELEILPVWFEEASPATEQEYLEQQKQKQIG